MSYKVEFSKPGQKYPAGIHAMGFVNPFPNWLAPTLLIAAGAVLLGVVKNPFGMK